MAEYTKVEHAFEPVYDKRSKILILGTFPSVKSRENNFYYGHPQNRFWKVMAQLLTGAESIMVPQTIEEKKQLLLANHIAIWDVIKSCSIIGSSDSSIKDVEVNDFKQVLDGSSIELIAANGGKAYDLYMKYAFPMTGREIIKLPSTSPANAAWSLEQLCETYREILQRTRSLS